MAAVQLRGASLVQITSSRSKNDTETDQCKSVFRLVMSVENKFPKLTRHKPEIAMFLELPIPVCSHLTHTGNPGAKTHGLY